MPSRQGSCQHLAGKDPQSQVGSRAEPPVANAKGDQCGVEQCSGVWSSAVSAVVQLTHRKDSIMDIHS